MNYHELLDRVTQTPAGYWTRVDIDRTTDGHDSLAVLIDDVGVSVAWGAEHMQGESWDHEPWSHAFPDRKVRGYYADLRWHGQPVYRALVLSVDGGRAYLPAGSPVTEPDKGIVGMKATPVETAVARLIDELSHGHSEFDSYLERANIAVE